VGFFTASNCLNCLWYRPAESDRIELVIRLRRQESIRRLAVLAALLVAATAWVSQAAPGDPVADLKAAVTLFQTKQSTAAIAALKPLAAKLPKLNDYVAWFLASAQFDAQQFSETPRTLEAVWAQTPPSPLVGRSALLAAQAYLQSGNPHQAVAVLRKYYSRVAQPQGDLAMASALAADNDLAGAAVYDQRVYYGYPQSAEAEQAGGDIAALKTKLGDRYPPALGTSILSRATKLLDAGQFAKARQELTLMISQLGGAERDTALVKIGVADYLQRQTAEAQKYLSTLSVDTPEADAERLYYVLLTARRKSDQDAISAVLDRLAKQHPESPWRLQSVVAAADSSLVDNAFETYEPLYRICYEAFPKAPAAGGCHWKIAVGHYLRRAPDAENLLREHLERYPASDDTPAALYFLGRLAETVNDPASARILYGTVTRQYPNHYHAALATERMTRLGTPAVSRQGTSAPAEAAAFLQNISFPVRVRARSFEPNALANQRLERARLLTAGGLEEWAEIELRYAAQNEDQPHVMALELASMARDRNAPEQAIRYLKRYAPDYLYIPIESAPADFWRLAFPRAYWAEVEKHAKANQVDPYVLAALIRQESEFDPKATSTANARGLAQILPSTGRELSRRLGIKYSTSRLFQPDTNLRLGAYYLKSIADRFDGRWEAALAAYNAGPRRANEWLMWGDFRDPAEFIEAVPFSQTRNYVQIVLRNAGIYRRIYAAN